MVRRSRMLAALLVPGFFAAAAGAAEAPRHRNFELALYCPARDVTRMADAHWLASNFEMLSRQLRISKVYLETHRSMQIVDRETLLGAKQFFESRGVKTAGGITTVLDEGFEFRSFCYSNPEHRQHLEKVVRLTASLFDELILDDFFFTTCKCERCIRAKGNRSWSEFRLALMTDAARNVIVGPARQVNPKIKVVIKYPNWYEHFPYAGFDLEAQPRIFDGIYTGNETRDAVTTQQHLQEYQGYSIQRYFENIKPGGNGGGWVDPYARGTLDRYAEQLALTALAKAREITLFCFSSLLDPIRQSDGTELPASRVAGAAADALERADAILSALGNPIGVASYKPYQSSGEDYLHSYLGMVGIPVDLTPELREAAPVTLLTESARFDPAIVTKMQKLLVNGKTVVITSGLLSALQGKGIEQIVDLEVTGRKVATRRFSDFRGVFSGTKEILLPQVRYATNDSWEDLTALDGANGYPLLHHADYANGRLYVLTVPDIFSDLYALPAQALDRIRRVATKGMPVRLQGEGRVGLLVYDNDTFVVHSFLDHATSVEVVVDGPDARLVELNPRASYSGNAPLPRTPRDGDTAFSVSLEPHAYRAFRKETGGSPAAPAAAPIALRAPALPPGHARAFEINKKLGRGVNIIGYDPLWKDRRQARFRDQHFARIAAAGFSSVRINLHPFRAMDAQNRLKASFWQTLDWAVKGALANQLAVILDMHEFGAMAEDPVAGKERLLAFWRQLAPRYKDAPDSVVFELLNEPFGKLTPEMWNDMLREALAIVRQTNPKRVVVIGPGQWNGIGALERLSLPQDDPDIILTVHYYEPMEFTHQGAPWAAAHKEKTGVAWTGGDAERQRTEADFAKAQAWAAAHGRPVLLGEFGAYDRGEMDSRARYTAHVARSAEKLGWSWAYWQFDSDFVVYDIARNAWVEPIRKALVP